MKKATTKKKGTKKIDPSELVSLTVMVERRHVAKLKELSEVRKTRSVSVIARSIFDAHL